MSKIISIYGGNGSGKTTLAVNLAYNLANKGKVVGVVSTDFSKPTITGFLGMNITSEQPNWSYICNKGHEIKDVAQKFFVQHPRYQNIFILSVANDTNCLTYAGENQMDEDDKVRNLYSHLQTSDFDYVIVDCVNDVNNLVSTYALYYAEKIIHIINPTIQGMIFCNSYESFLNKMRNKNTDNPIIHVANADQNYVGISEFESKIGLKFDFLLPYEKQALKAENDGIPLLETFTPSLFSSGYPKKFEELVSKLINEKKVGEKDG